MLCRKINQFFNLKATTTVNRNAPNSYTTQHLHTWLEILLSTADRSAVHKYSMKMSTVNKFRMLLIDWRNTRLWRVFARSPIVNTVVRRCRNDRAIREVLHTFKQTFLRPRRTFLFAAVAAYNKEDSSTNISCSNSITDDELESLLHGLDRIKELAYKTLFCKKCGKRLVIEKKLPGITYCTCKEPQSDYDSEGWVPYMEAESVVIWRKEYKKGQGLYAYRVYGRYEDVRARDFASVQLDTAYRRRWDPAVAALRVLRRGAGGLPAQAVLHWEVLWPRLFTNRDYVYLRRHQHYDVRTPPLPDFIRELPAAAAAAGAAGAAAAAGGVGAGGRRRGTLNRTYTIISRSCEDPKVPETRAAVRVTEYWSHMAVRTTGGIDNPGMEFLLTYYDEPAVGGMPSGVASWATGRAAPAYLERMRAASLKYPAYLEDHPDSVSQPENQFLIPETAPSDELLVTDDGSAHVEDETTDSAEEPEVTDSAIPSLPEMPYNTVVTVACSGDNCLTSESMECLTKEEEDSWWEYIFPFYYFT